MVSDITGIKPASIDPAANNGDAMSDSATLKHRTVLFTFAFKANLLVPDAFCQTSVAESFPPVPRSFSRAGKLEVGLPDPPARQLLRNVTSLN
jgi:hypothetical protein